MMRLKRFVIAVAAAATVAAGSLATTPTASALPLSCSFRLGLFYAYLFNAQAANAVGNYGAWVYWNAKAETVMLGC